MPTAATPPSQCPAQSPRLQSPPNFGKNSSSPSLTALWKLLNYHSWNEAPVQLLNCVSSTEKVLPRGCTNSLTPTVWGKVEGVTLTVPRTLLSRHWHSSALLFSQSHHNLMSIWDTSSQNFPPGIKMTGSEEKLQGNHKSFRRPLLPMLLQQARLKDTRQAISKTSLRPF